MKPYTRLIISAVSILVGLVTFAIIMFFKEPNMKLIITLFSIGISCQGLALLDQIWERIEKEEEK